MGYILIMNLALWLVFGLLSGVIANWLSPKRSMRDLVGSIVLGMMGAMLGGLMANVFIRGIGFQFQITALVVALIGACFVLFLNNSFQKEQFKSEKSE